MAQKQTSVLIERADYQHAAASMTSAVIGCAARSDFNSTDCVWPAAVTAMAGAGRNPSARAAQRAGWAA
jgi:hypothetical protein